MVSVPSSSPSLSTSHFDPASLAANLLRGGSPEKAAQLIGESIHSLEAQILDTATRSAKGDKNADAELKGLEFKYQRAMRAFTLLSELMKNTHDMLMRVIGNIRLN